jgi:hypothetical protein
MICTQDCLLLYVVSSYSDIPSSDMIYQLVSIIPTFRNLDFITLSGVRMRS